MGFEGQVVQHIRDGKAFTFTSLLQNIDSNTEKDFLLLKNPSGSGKDILITHFKFGTDSQNVRSMIRIYSNPTVTTDGTSLTISNTLIKSSPPSSGMEAYKFPTTSAKGGNLNLDINPSDSPSKGLNRWYWVHPGNSILLTVENSVSNAKTFGDIYWLEGI
jgi:hypothetical protein